MGGHDGKVRRTGRDGEVADVAAPGIRGTVPSVAIKVAKPFLARRPSSFTTEREGCRTSRISVLALPALGFSKPRLSASSHSHAASSGARRRASETPWTRSRLAISEYATTTRDRLMNARSGWVRSLSWGPAEVLHAPRLVASAVLALEPESAGPRTRGPATSSPRSG